MMENDQQAIGGCYRVLEIVPDQPMQIETHRHSEICSIPHVQSGTFETGTLYFVLDSVGVGVYLRLKNIQHRLCQKCILFCEKMLTRWVMTLLVAHYLEDFLKLNQGSLKGLVNALGSQDKARLCRESGQNHDEDS